MEHTNVWPGTLRRGRRPRPRGPAQGEHYLRAVSRPDELARRPDQLSALLGALDCALDEATLAEIDRIVAEEVRDPVGPEFMAPPLAAPTA